jgi:hypothetical protein
MQCACTTATCAPVTGWPVAERARPCTICCWSAIGWWLVVTKQGDHKLPLPCQCLVHPGQHVVDVALRVVRVDLNGAGHAPCNAAGTGEGCLLRGAMLIASCCWRDDVLIESMT